MESTNKYNNHYKNVNRDDGVVRINHDGNRIIRKKFEINQNNNKK